METNYDFPSKLSSLAEELRLRLLRLLEKHELSVAELCDIVQQPQSTVSRHLKVLADQSWLISRRVGTNNLYRLLLDELDEPSRKLWLITREQTDAWPTTSQDQLRLQRVLRDRKADAQSFFATQANQWDKLRDEQYGSRFMFDAMLSLLPSETIVADLGCGTGQLLAQLAPHVKQVIGIDNSAAMLKSAKTRTQSFDNVTLIKADLADIPLESESCDAVTMLLSLSYLEHTAPALQSMARLLKPRGKAVIVDLLLHSRDDFRRQMEQTVSGFSPDSIKAMLKEAGLHSSKIYPLEPEPDVKGPALFLATAIK